MKYWKIMVDGYIYAIQMGGGGNPENEITKEEYERIMDIINNKPEVEQGYELKMKADLTWELSAIEEKIEKEQGIQESQEEGGV